MQGEVVHTLGYPLSQRGTYGGGFVYRMGGNRISIGLIHTLDYRNPYQSPYHEWNRFKAHPRIREVNAFGHHLGWACCHPLLCPPSCLSIPIFSKRPLNVASLVLIADSGRGRVRGVWGACHQRGRCAEVQEGILMVSMSWC